MYVHAWCARELDNAEKKKETRYSRPSLLQFNGCVVTQIAEIIIQNNGSLTRLNA